MSKYVGYIYKITNTVTGKIYVGKRQKSYFDKYYWGSGTYIKNSIAKYGIENFSREIIEWCTTVNELLAKEQFWISELDAKNPAIGYNLADGGIGSTVGGTANANYCYVNKDNAIFRILKSELLTYLAQGYQKGRGYGSNGLLGKKKSPEVRAHMRTAAKGKHNHSGMNNPCYGVKYYWANDGLKNKRIPLDQDLPDGFIKGKLQKKYERTEKQKAWDVSPERSVRISGDRNPSKSHVLGKHIYNDGIHQRLFFDDCAPSGWTKGRIK